MTNLDRAEARRTEIDIFSDLRILCTSKGYIHAVAYFCWRDNLIEYSGSQVVAKDLEHQHSQDRLIRTEISTLIGLMVQAQIDLSLSKSDITQNYIKRTETLLNELHHALMEPWSEGRDSKVGTLPERDPFTNAAAMREPIFYAGDSAFNFQYRDFARLKYRADDPWLEANKGFQIKEACQIAEAIERVQSSRHLGHARSGKRPFESSALLSGFIFTIEDVVDASGASPSKVKRFLDAFSCGPDERNASFTALNEFNVTNSTPIIKTADGSYILLQHYSLLEAI